MKQESVVQILAVYCCIFVREFVQNLGVDQGSSNRGIEF